MQSQCWQVIKNHYLLCIGTTNNHRYFCQVFACLYSSVNQPTYLSLNPSPLAKLAKTKIWVRGLDLSAERLLQSILHLIVTESLIYESSARVWRRCDQLGSQMSVWCPMTGSCVFFYHTKLLNTLHTDLTGRLHGFRVAKSSSVALNFRSCYYFT